MEQSILNDPLLSGHQVAVLLGRRDRTMEYWRLTGKGPKHVKLEGKISYFVSDIDRWLKEQTSGTVHAMTGNQEGTQ